MKKAGALASALRNSGATVAASKLADADKTSDLPSATHTEQPSRVGTKAITVHFPEEVFDASLKRWRESRGGT
jgi:uncharacterized protein with von Willebrand factor type A (vWA) domain